MLKVLNPHDRNQPFPPVESALEDPNGLLAIGGCLSVRRLVNAYRHGIFPWYSVGEPILWWSPNPRLVLEPEGFNLSRTLRRSLRREEFQFSCDRAFEAVLHACSEPRAYAQGTWLTPEMKRAYVEMHRQGYAHSVEAWQGDELVGGLYGVAIGRMFFGESMFHRVDNASKAALAFACAAMAHWGYRLIDCQVHTPHLMSLGAREIARAEFVTLLGRHRDAKVDPSAWKDCRVAWR
ncbi:leucyl/phenylalanyl-tRNA--protein transferase [Methylolobus aquaticus]